MAEQRHCEEVYRLPLCELSKDGKKEMKRILKECGIA
jgi:hypothetical protein